MTPAARAQQLADAHWEYVEDTLNAHGCPAPDIKVAKHHYLSAAKHFYLHATEDHASGLCRPAIGEPLTLEEVAEINAAVIPESQCDSCMRVGCPLTFKEFHRDCAGYTKEDTHAA